MLVRSILFGRAAVRCAQASLRPGQRIAPAIKDAQSEFAVWRPTASRCFGGERLRSDRKASLAERLSCSIARQQRVWSIRNEVCHLASSLLRAVPRSIAMTLKYWIGFVCVRGGLFRLQLKLLTPGSLGPHHLSDLVCANFLRKYYTCCDCYYAGKRFFKSLETYCRES